MKFYAKPKHIHFTSRHSFYDDFRYINFSRTLVNEGNGFDIRDGIFRVPVTGLYMFTVHALPMEDRPFMVQIHLNDQSVAAFSNGESGMSLLDNAPWSTLSKREDQRIDDD